MTKKKAAAMRVRVAKDVLRLLEEKKVHAMKGNYFVSNEVRLFTPRKQLQEAFSQQKTCCVCALGAVFVAGVLRFDKITTDITSYYNPYGDMDLHGSRPRQISIRSASMKDYLAPYFSAEMLDRIEACFEMTWYGPIDHETEPSKMRATLVALLAGRSSDIQRLRWIMRSIIAQRGDFIPWETPEWKAFIKKSLACPLPARES